MKLLTLDKFIKYNTDSFLNKIYISRASSVMENLDIVGDEFFIQLNSLTDKEVSLNKTFPILNCCHALTEHYLNEGSVNLHSVYNKPEFIEQVSDKKSFHEILDFNDNVPKTWFNIKDKNQFKFPIIAKPKHGHSGIGIKKFDNLEELESEDISKFDIFSEWIDKKSEHRIFIFKGEIIGWLERFSLNSKASTGKGSSDEEMKFQYCYHKDKTLPKNIKSLADKTYDIFKTIDFLCFDIMVDQSNKPWIIEANSCPGLIFDIPVRLYIKIYEDYYKKPITGTELEKLNKLKTKLNNDTVSKDGERFKII